MKSKYIRGEYHDPDGSLTQAAKEFQTAAHTPGPWYSCELTNGDITIEHHTTYDDRIEDGAIAMVDGKRGELNRANARLIAAAPRMLELLRESLEASEAKRRISHATEGDVRALIAEVENG